MMVNMIAPEIGQIPILYGPHGKFLRLEHLNERAKEILEPFAVQLVAQGGLEFFNSVVLELKWKPKDD